MMTPIPDRIMWCYGEYQTLYGTVDGVELVQGLSNFDALDPAERHLIIINDQMDDVDQRVANLFTKYSHHRNLNVMLIIQNLFKNPRDTSQIMALAHQMYPRRTHGYMVIDMKQDTPCIL